jgi:oligopeptide/dipeptide ABC transporter ATP-binding protein
MAEPILRVDSVVKHYPLTQGIVVRKQIGAVKAVDGVSLEIAAGETLGIVGESGCGKSTLARLMMALEQPTSGQILFKGEPVVGRSARDLRSYRRNVQLVMQDPYTSLNPRMTVGDIVGEPFEIHPDAAPKGDRRRRVQELLDLVGLNPEFINRYPHQFSGGQRQRIGVARALALRPEVIVLDEPVSALDVSVQAQVVNLLGALQRDLSLTYVFIAHDLSVVRHISDRVAVMYLGKVVELGDEDQIFEGTAHPYAQALLSAVPVPDPSRRHERNRIVLEGDVPSPANPPSGCRFRTRCWKAEARCADEEPLLTVRPGIDHAAACHFAGP